MDTSRIVIFIFILVILFASPDSSGGPITLPADFSQTIAKERGWLNELGNSSYGTVGNLTGYVETDWWSKFDVVKGLVSEMVDDVLGYALRKSHHPRPRHYGWRRRQRYQLDHSLNHPRPKRPWWHLRNPPHSPSNRPPRRKLFAGYRWHDYSADDKQNNKRNLNPDDDDDSYFGPGHAAFDRESKVPQHAFPEIPLYHNLTGMLSGTWNRLNVAELYKPVLNTTLERNITHDRGKFWVVMDEDQPRKEWKEVEGIVQTVRMNMQLRNEFGGNSQNVPMKGVHFLDTGLVVGVSNSDKFPGIFGLPHLTPTETTFQLTKTSMMKTLERMINDHEKSEDPYPPWIPNDEQFLSNPIPHCEYITYFQIHPIRTYSMGSPYEITEQSMVDVIERELRKPSGEPLPIDPPDLVASAIVYSPDCGFVLSTRASRGLKVEVYQGRISRFALGAALLTLIEISLLIRQMNNTSTPSTLSRVSFWTVGILSVVGGYSFVAFLTIGLYVEKCSLQLLTASFLSLIFFMFFGTRYLMSIYGIQRPEREPTPVPTTTAPNRPTVPATNVEPGTLPLPVTATVQTPPDNDTSDASTLSTRLWLFLVATTFLTFYSFSWPPTPRYIFYLFLLSISLSFWIPQIWRNCYRNCRKALKWEFVLGISMTRLAAVFYVYGYDGNVLWVEREDWVCWFALGWVGIQIWVLGIQELLGPRFLVPENLLPPAYDYHPILPINDLEASLPLAASSPISLTKPPQHCTFDCAICMQSVEIPIAPSTEVNMRDDDNNNQSSEQGGIGNGYWSRFFGRKIVVGRQNYMVTPCKHVFHSVCLEGWMRVRLQCPICRNSLPPI